LTFQEFANKMVSVIKNNRRIIKGVFMKSPVFNCLVFGAHPDDAERQMGGTIAHLVSMGHAVTIVSLTAGQRGTHGDELTRRAEFAKASEMLGAKSDVLDFMDTQVMDTLESRAKIAHQIRLHKPRVIFVPYPARGYCLFGNNAHPDHLGTGELVTASIPLANIQKFDALSPHRVSQLLYYMLPEGVAPNLFVPISEEEWQRALASAQSYVSQEESFTGNISLSEYLTGMRRMYRKMGVVLPDGCQLAEGFFHASPMVLRGNDLQCFSSAARTHSHVA
jgi:LmbE family N-acetylglucosaminyl deacetylase